MMRLELGVSNEDAALYRSSASVITEAFSLNHLQKQDFLHTKLRTHRTWEQNYGCILDVS